MGVHTCHWPGCTQPVPPKLWGCKAHWYRLPKRLRDRIWATYRPGQEISKTPSREYIQAAREVQDWIAAATAPNGDLFSKPTRRAPRVMMHAVDAGVDFAHFICSKCGHDAGWLTYSTLIDLRRGEPCPHCNGQRSPQQ